MLFEERANYILKKLEQENLVKTNDLVEEMNVSIDTIRRDLRKLEEEGKVTCIRGGACASEEALQYSPFFGRQIVNEDLKRIEEICDKKVIDIVQLHGLEEEKELNYLRSRIVQPVIKAFCIKKEEDVRQAERSPADFILLDSGAGTGRTFEWEWIKHMERPYFLAGGIHIDNVEKALEQLKPYAIDVSSGIETEGRKDKRKMAANMTAVRKERKL